VSYRAIQHVFWEDRLKAWALEWVKDPLGLKPKTAEWVPAHPAHGTFRGRVMMERDSAIERLKTPWQKDEEERMKEEG